jgi:hypothetical protein
LHFGSQQVGAASQHVGAGAAQQVGAGSQHGAGAGVQQGAGAGVQHGAGAGAGAQHGVGAGAQHVGAGAQQVGAGAQHLSFLANNLHFLGASQQVGAGSQQVGAGSQQLFFLPKRPALATLLIAKHIARARKVSLRFLIGLTPLSRVFGKLGLILTVQILRSTTLPTFLINFSTIAQLRRAPSFRLLASRNCLQELNSQAKAWFQCWLFPCRSISARPPKLWRNRRFL